MKATVAIAAILGVIFCVVGIMYFTQPAGSLPAFFPGFKAGDMKDHHTKHAIAAIGLGVVCFVFAWFQSGTKKTSTSA